MSETAKFGKYIYCVIESSQPRTFGPFGIGGRGDNLYSVCFNDISAVVSDAPIERYRVSRENTLAHEKAVEQVMADHTVLPVKFATVAKDEQRVKRILEKEHDRLKELLNEMNGKSELGIKVMFEEDVIYKDILDRYNNIRLLKEKVAALPPEKTHYERMEIGRVVAETLEKEKQTVKEDILNCLSPLAVSVRTNDTYGDLMVINAAFLVAKEREPEFDQAVSELAGKYGKIARFKYVGALPPFNFVNLVIEVEEY